MREMIWMKKFFDLTSMTGHLLKSLWQPIMKVISKTLATPKIIYLVLLMQLAESHGTRTSTARSAISKQLDVEELEMLLEAYFVQIDGTLNKLSTPREYVDDTEDYINIMLDDKQNHLLQMGVMLTTATLVISASIVVAGTFGINIHIELFDETKAGMPEFLWTIGGGTAGTIFLYVIAIAWCKIQALDRVVETKLF